MKNRPVLFLLVVVAAGLLGHTWSAAQSVTIGFDNNLRIELTNGHDTCVLDEWFEAKLPQGVQITINGTDFGQWPTSERSGITVLGLDGDDLIDLRQITTDVFFLDLHPDFNVQLLGYAGNDTIYGSQGNDLIYGLEGDDLIKGMAGNDILLAGYGNDRVFGNDGHDIVEGEEGDYDKLYGGCGNDKIGDKDGVRYAHGEDGNDKLVLIFRDGWLLNHRLRLEKAVTGGYDGDYLEIYNNSAAAMKITLHGDVWRGYSNPGDQLLTFGAFTEDSEYVGFESVSHF